MTRRVYSTFMALILGVCCSGGPAFSSPFVYWTLVPHDSGPGICDSGEGETGGEGPQIPKPGGPGLGGENPNKPRGGKLASATGELHSEGQAGTTLFVVEAGTFGVFTFSLETLPECAGALAQGEEEVKVYPHPGPAPFEMDCLPNEACANSLEDVVGEYIVIVDWRNWHGQAVDQVIRSATDPSIQTVLIPLESHVLPSPKVTEVDLLISLAQLATQIDGGDHPPLVINMSFGRGQDLTDPENSSCSGDSLSCQVSHLLDHLAQPSGAQEPRSVLVAAAGNHRNRLFPSSLESVVAVGSLDLRQFASNGAALPTWETPTLPDVPEALMPGSAICMNFTTGGVIKESMAPSGASFSSGFFAAWIADLLLWQGDLVRTHLAQGPGWEPMPDCSTDPSCPFVMRHQGTIFESPSNNGGQRMAAILAEDLGACGLGGSPSVSVVAGLTSVGSSEGPAGGNPLNRDSLVRLVARQLEPAPLPITCVPCTLCCDVPILDAPLVSEFGEVESHGLAAKEIARAGTLNPSALNPNTSRTSTSRTSASRTSAVRSNDERPSDIAPAVESQIMSGLVEQGAPVGQMQTVHWEIDLHNGWALPDGMELVTMYARVPPQLLRIELHDEDLELIRQGQVSTLLVSGEIFPPDLSSQLSLISVLSLFDSETETYDYFWNATPLLWQGI